MVLGYGQDFKRRQLDNLGRQSPQLVTAEIKNFERCKIAQLLLVSAGVSCLGRKGVRRTVMGNSLIRLPRIFR